MPTRSQSKTNTVVCGVGANRKTPPLKVHAQSETGKVKMNPFFSLLTVQDRLQQHRTFAQQPPTVPSSILFSVHSSYKPLSKYKAFAALFAGRKVDFQSAGFQPDLNSAHRHKLLSCLKETGLPHSSPQLPARAKDLQQYLQGGHLYS